ncbi:MULTISPECIES: FAD-dependent monooxygenase [unclassified Amycolatopsis]|uniref:FAD-dependent monooxygenase n=1 Tax=unclassified Amycolatopsis TaxID=2618356 RepID=UPI0028755D35|nr:MULTISPECIES: FAD-dependent monooxygenase [unclassified Amycolatopsis]MDS0138957.1 FAD-dependent monooxygenase [Amycolatopsis sp. 505]MDS0147629.1 FAD-dependent monooxygenase [Amycolatopsis sp. CM201R]
MNRDVVISGGGPVGSMLACELRLAGVDVLVVERLPEPDQTIKAGSVNLTTAEAFYRRGLLPATDAVVQQNFAQIQKFLESRGGGGPKAVPVGHFAGIMVTSGGVDFADPAFRDVGPAARVVVIQQQAVEAILAERAAELGVEIRRGAELTGFDADDSGVTVHLGDGASVRAGWLVGADGGRSRVRKLAGFDFPGTDPAITGRQALTELTGADALPAGWQHGPGGLYVHGPTPGRILTVEFDGPPEDRDAPITAQEIEDSFRRVSGADVRVTKVHSATRFTDNARQATTYRQGRVLLAGDAAHVHSPFGGQGLNLGIGDAVNLGWKLAATIQGWAPEGLLDTYTAERHPIGEWVLEWTRAQVALMRSDVRTRALRQVMTDLLATGDGATYLAKKLSGVLHRYAIDGEHDLTGRAAPDFAFADGSRLGERLHDGKALLLDLADAAGLRETAAGWAGRVNVLSAKCDSEPALTGVLVRPDGHIAWASEDGSTADLEAALRTWFGEPA